MASSAGRVLVYGGKGALGSAIVNHFKSNNWWVASIDLIPNEDAHSNIVITKTDSWTEQEQEVLKAVEGSLGDEKVDAVYCVAGGWAGGNAASSALVKNSDAMWKQSVWSSVIAANISSKWLKENGILALTGAKAALEGTPGMMGYGLAKAAVHQLVKSLAAGDSGIPSGAVVTAILPVTLDTPMNRKFMSNADMTKWTPLEFVADLFYKWATKAERPENGSLLQLITDERKTSVEPAS
ncbi:dihydropteridine reductase-like [Corticium candelabrum]|uniref:dihydropteridine reductase-like n=1 Tax=Corticium candelabrum TaxID=121492 RepID=UPI002E273441|nr:dihydropteridine reductase-like [Corticium candelabrum]